MDEQICLTEKAKNSPIRLPEITEGDWPSYKRWTAQEISQSSSVCMGYKNNVAYQRTCALAYLGKRAQLHGGVCSRTQPRVLTSSFITTLEATNRTERFRRYPWLETLLNLLAQIERIQEEVSSCENVISLVPVPKL